MSRIHEALKKAEQERVTTPAGPGQPHLTLAAFADPSTLLEDTPVIPLSGAATAPSYDSLTLETMLARCQYREWKPDLKTMLFMNGNDVARGTEEYRTLRSRLYHVREKMTLKAILVTSALPQEGKSFTAANLAQVMARQHNQRVLLVDADLRRPQLHLMLGTSTGPGLAEYLQEKNDEFSIMQRGSMENLFFIPSGSGIQNPAELVSNGRLKLLLSRVGPLFDWIVVDSPPAVPVSDASVLAKACDGVLIVVRSEATPSDSARKARLEFPDQVLVGIVLNGTNNSNPHERYY